ncbi:MAG: hypothetical protein MIL41_09815, partial [Hyphomicrobiales bacterium]
MAFSSTPSALQVDPEAARRLLVPMLPRRLRTCLDQNLQVAAARTELAAEIAALAPDAAGLVSAWATKATTDGDLWRDPDWIARRSALIQFLDAQAIERDQPAARALADVVVLLSCAGDDRVAAARLAQPLWHERETIPGLKLQLAILAEAQTQLALGRVARPGANMDTDTDADADVVRATDLATA